MLIENVHFELRRHVLLVRKEDVTPSMPLSGRMGKNCTFSCSDGVICQIESDSFRGRLDVTLRVLQLIWGKKVPQPQPRASPEKIGNKKGGGMTDLELTLLCAQAMDIAVCVDDGSPGMDKNGNPVVFPQSKGRVYIDFAPMISAAIRHAYGPRLGLGNQTAYYDPLHDDAQVMALVKKFAVEINTSIEDGYWTVTEYSAMAHGRDKDLNRAIVKCIAEMRFKVDRMTA